MRLHGFTRLPICLLAIIVSAALSERASATAPEAEPKIPTPDKQTPGQQPFDINKLPPQMKLGLRVEAVRRSIPTLDVVVIVPDADAFLDAITHWTLRRRYPVLIDDGSAQSMENIARFVRAFKPAKVLRWTGADRDQQNVQPLKDRIERAIASAWEAPSYAELDARWKSLSISPPGVVVMSTKDPTWTAGAALAAGRGEPIVWLDLGQGRPGAAMKRPRYDQLASELRKALDSMRHPWRDLGDSIDAVTLCTNTASKVIDEKRMFALTDLLGRHASGARWGWAGQITGDESQAAYTAMCALFVRAESVWIFNGFGAKAPFNRYSPQDAADPLQRAGLDLIIDDAPNTGARAWRSRAARPVDAGLILVNTKGSRLFFDLTPGRAYASDIPMLRKPAIVHFLHSFSAQRIDDRHSIAARWLEQGAYAYVGSVHEPFLRAFHTPGEIARRFVSGAPLGAAVRMDGAEPWRVAVFGDPLITISPRAAEPPHIKADPALDGAAPLESELVDSLRAQRLPEACRLLVMLGRDGDALRLAQAAINEGETAWTSELARFAYFAIFRTGQTQTLLEAYKKLTPADAEDTLLVDTLWQALRPLLSTTRDPVIISALTDHIRTESIGDDAAALAPALRRTQGAGAAVAFVNGLMDRATNKHDRTVLKNILSRVRR